VKKKNKLLIIVLLIWSANCIAQSGKGGNTGLAFLKLGAGARATGVGEAYTAIANDATAVFWNPAGLAGLQHSQLAFTHTEWVQDISNEFFAFVFPAFRGVFGLNVNVNTVGGIERRVNPSEEPLGTVEANDVAFGFSYGRSLSPSLKVGLTAKYVYEKIFIESAAGFALDFGAQFQPFAAPLKFGVSMQNFGSMGRLRAQSIELPRTVRAGLSYFVELKSLGGGVLLAADGVKVFENDLRGNFGVELQLKELLAFRFGYQTGLDDRQIAGGFGLHIKRYYLDYGYAPFGSNLGDTHRFSFSLDL
jgi:hypothetical protein